MLATFNKQLSTWSPHCGLLLLGAFLIFSSSGCSKSSSSSSATVATLAISAEFDWGNTTEFYDWQTESTAARVEFRVRGFSHGGVWVRITDGNGVEIYNQIYRSWEDYYIINPDEYLDIGFTDGNATPGLWTVRLDFEEFTGHAYITVDDISAPPVVAATLGEPLPSSELDTTFGTGGFASYIPALSYGADIAIDDTGRILVVGTTIDNSGNRDLAVWRYSPAGVLDISFGQSGIHRLGGALNSMGRAIAIDANNRILATGWIEGTAGNLDMILIRIIENGTLDSSFGVAGVVIHSGPDDEIGRALAIDDNGAIVVGVNSALADNSAGRAMVFRYLNSGLLDFSFSGDGIAVSSDPADRCLDLIVDNFNRPLVVGQRGNNLGLWRFTAGGNADNSFGIAGFTTGGNPPIGEERTGISVALSPIDSSIAVCGFRAILSNNVDLATWRFGTNGLPDFTYSGDGFDALPFQNGGALGTEVIIDNFDRMLVLGVTRNAPQIGTDDAAATAWRFQPGGGLDPSFAAAGIVRFDIRTVTNTVTAANSLAIDASGRVLVTGSIVDVETGAADLSIWRLIP